MSLMKKIESAMMDAVESRKKWQSGNTSVRYEGGKSFVRLHGYLIAIYNHTTNKWRYSDARVEHENDDCGTQTTMSRLNACGANICRRKGVWMHRGTKHPFVNDFCEGEGGKIHYNRHKGTYEVWSN